MLVPPSRFPPERALPAAWSGQESGQIFNMLLDVLV
jgi:hypothetical protein